MTISYAAMCWRLKKGRLEILLDHSDNLWSLPNQTFAARQFSDRHLNEFVHRVVGRECARSAEELKLPDNFRAHQNGNHTPIKVVPFHCSSGVELCDRRDLHWTPVDRACNIVEDDDMGLSLAFVNKCWSTGNLDALRDRRLH